MMDKRTWVLDSFLLAIILPGALSCGLGTKHTIKGEDGSYDTKCCLETTCNIGTAAVLCSFEGGPAWCKDCGVGFFQNSSGPSYRITSCYGHRTCSYTKGKVRIEEGTFVSNAVCGCDFHRGYVAKEELIKNPNGNTFRLVENPESCRKSSCPELKRDGEYVTCHKTLSSERTTARSTSKQLPSHESTGTEDNSHNSHVGGIFAAVIIPIIAVVVGLLVVKRKGLLCFRSTENKRREVHTPDSNSTPETESLDSLLKPNENDGNVGNRNDIMDAVDMRTVPTTFPQQETERKYEVEETQDRVQIRNDGLRYDQPRDEKNIVDLTSNATSAATGGTEASNVHETNTADSARVDVYHIDVEQSGYNGASDHASVHSNQGTTSVPTTAFNQGTTVNICNGGNQYIHTHQCNIL